MWRSKLKQTLLLAFQKININKKGTWIFQNVTYPVKDLNRAQCQRKNAIYIANVFFNLKQKSCNFSFLPIWKHSGVNYS